MKQLFTFCETHTMAKYVNNFYKCFICFEECVFFTFFLLVHYDKLIHHIVDLLIFFAVPLIFILFRMVLFDLPSEKTFMNM